MAPATSSINALYDIHDAIEHLYEVTFLGRNILTTVTQSFRAVTEWINDVRRDDTTTKRYVGFEAELCVAEDLSTEIGVVQFCVGSRCLVVQLRNPTSCPTPLYHFLSLQNNVFVGIDIRTKMKMLAEHLSIDPLVQSMDLGEVAERRYNREGLRYAEQGELALSALGMEVKMPEVDHTDWGTPLKLSYAQVQYACVDAFLNLQIGRKLTEGEEDHRLIIRRNRASK